MATSLSTLNRTKYSGLDFDTHGDDLRARLQVQFAADYNDFAVSALGIMLLDIVAYGLDTLSFYLDRRATDTYLATARTRKSVARLSRQLGYKMRAAVAASVDVQVTIDQVYAFNVTIPQGFKFEGPDGLVFEAAQAVTFTVAEQGPGNPKLVPTYQGETLTETFVSDGTSSQVFELRRVPDDEFIVSGTVEVAVDGGAWDEKEFLEYGASNQFEVGYNDDPPTLRFGDGVSGNIPGSGVTIACTYVSSRGRAGQAGAGTIVDVVSPLVVSFQEIDLSVTNTEPATGGEDPESLERAKALAPKVAKTRDVAVTRSDYEALATSFASPLFGAVAAAQAIVSRSADTDLELQNLIADINSAVEELLPVVATNASSALSALTAVDANATSLSSTLTSVGTSASDLDSALVDALDDARAAKNKAIEIVADTAAISSAVAAGKAAIDAVTTAGSSQLTTSDKNALKAYFDDVQANAVTISAAAGVVQSSIDSEIADIGVARNEAAEIGTPLTGGSLLYTATQYLITISTNSGTAQDAISAIESAGESTQAAVSAALAEIEGHVDAILAADCKANLVTVPILTRNAAGFFAAPSSGLIDALQTYLDGRKEVTQTVVVTSGAAFLVPAVVSARVGVTSGFSLSVVRAAVEAAIDGVLRDRLFGEALFVSDLSQAVLAVNGVSFVNVTINGYLDGGETVAGKLDGSGNLVISDSEVITKGVVTVSTEAA